MGFCSPGHFPLFQKKSMFRLGDRMKYFDLEKMGLPSQSFVFLFEKGFEDCKWEMEAEWYLLEQSRPSSKGKTRA